MARTQKKVKINHIKTKKKEKLIKKTQKGIGGRHTRQGYIENRRSRRLKRSRSRTPPRRRNSPRRRRSRAPSPSSPRRRRNSPRRRRSRNPPRRGRVLSLSIPTRNNLIEESIRGYSHAIIEILNKHYNLHLEYYPNPNTDKSLQYFEDTLNNLRIHHNDIKRKIEKVKKNVSDDDLNYLLIDGENIFYGVNDSEAIRQELERVRRLTNAGCIFLFCQRHSIERSGKFSFLSETPGRFIIIDANNKTEIDDIYLVMTEKIIRKKKGYPSCSIGRGYPSDKPCHGSTQNMISIYTNDYFSWV